MESPANLYAGLPRQSGQELFTTLLDNPNCRVERIVSYGQTSPDGFWYDQAWDEWVLILSGSAELDLDAHSVVLSPGDHLLIPAGLRHRVIRTDPDVATIWLAVHLNPPKA
jgi:cupin 2 domain-containing protein